VRLRRDRAVLTVVAAGLDEPFPADVLEGIVRDFDERAVTKPPPP
jgi:hypothetical protein